MKNTSREEQSMARLLQAKYGNRMGKEMTCLRSTLCFRKI